MATTMYAEEELYPVDKESGKANKSEASTIFEVYVSNFFGDHQIYLKVTDENGDVKQFHVSKEQAQSLAHGFDGADAYIGYDNT